MAMVADDLAFLCHHAVAALGTCIEKLFSLTGIGPLFHLSADFQEGRQGGNGGFGIRGLIFHDFRLARPFWALND